MPRSNHDLSEFEEYLEQVDENYQKRLMSLQLELLNLQKHIIEKQKRVVILFEGRDTAGKGGAIQRFTQFLNPRHYRVVALNKPTIAESSQWYFQRYIKHLPSAGEIVFFDRSWYNRSIVEPALGFCTDHQYQLFMKQVLLFERLLVEDGIHFIKFWFSIDQKEQKKRLQDRKVNPFKQWKLSPTDLVAHEKFEIFSKYREQMFSKTSPDYSPWVRVNGNDKKVARIESMKYLLAKFAPEFSPLNQESINYNEEIVHLISRTKSD